MDGSRGEGLEGGRADMVRLCGNRKGKRQRLPTHWPVYKGLYTGREALLWQSEGAGGQESMTDMAWEVGDGFYTGMARLGGAQGQEVAVL